MTDAPDMEPAGLEAATNKAEKIIRAVRDLIVAESKHLRRQTSHGDSERLEADDAHAALLDFTAVDCAEALRIVERRRAARSAPEAGKAVDETLTAMAGFLVFLKDMRFTGSWDLPTLNRAIEVGETIAEQQAALASSPAPTGAEDDSDLPTAEDVRGILGPAPQAVPAEEIAGDELGKITAALAKSNIALTPVADGGGAWHYEVSMPLANPLQPVAPAEDIAK
jgi:hypothetical protein